MNREALGIENSIGLYQLKGARSGTGASAPLFNRLLQPSTQGQATPVKSAATNGGMSFASRPGILSSSAQLQSAAAE